MRDPVSMQCGHSGCKDCLEKIRSSPLEYRHCPICREQHNFNSSTFTINVSLQQLIFALKVKCGEPSCEWEGTLVAGKLRKDNCCFVKLVCWNEGCSFYGEKWKVDEHQQECPQKMLPCARCGQLVTDQEAEAHVEVCPCINCNCPYGCGIKLQRLVKRII